MHLPSPGQWQKLALARASMRPSPLLFVLDEPTASVSHRFSTVAGADLILVLEAGRLIEAGTHEALLAASSTYAELYSIQDRLRPDDPRAGALTLKVIQAPRSTTSSVADA